MGPIVVDLPTYTQTLGWLVAEHWDHLQRQQSILYLHRRPDPGSFRFAQPSFFSLFPSLWIRNSHHLKRRTKCPSTLWFSPSFRSPPLNLLSYSLSYPHVTIFVLFFFVLSQPASICIIIIPNSLTFHLFFLSFFLHPKHILFFLSLKPYTFLHDTPYPFSRLSTHDTPIPLLRPLLSSPLIQPSRFGHQWYHTLHPRFLKSLYLSKRYALFTRSRFRIRKVFCLFAPPLSLAIPPTTDVYYWYKICWTYVHGFVRKCMLSLYPAALSWNIELWCTI